MRNFVATVALSNVLMFGTGPPANASSVTKTENHFSLNNRKKD